MQVDLATHLTTYYYLPSSRVFETCEVTTHSNVDVLSHIQAWYKYLTDTQPSRNSCYSKATHLHMTTDVRYMYSIGAIDYRKIL